MSTVLAHAYYKSTNSTKTENVMNKSQIKRLLQPELTKLKNAQNNITLNKWIRAKAIFDIHGMIVWKKSPYGSFAEYCRIELEDYPLGSIYVWNSHYKALHDAGYSWNDVQNIATKINYTKLTHYLPILINRIAISKLIKQAEAYWALGQAVKVNNPRNPNIISLYLEKKYRDKLESLLIGYGFTPSKNGRKVGISEAFCRYLDTI